MLHVVVVVVGVVDLVHLLHFLVSIHYTYLSTASDFAFLAYVVVVVAVVVGAAGYYILSYFVVGIVSILKMLVNNAAHSVYCFYYPLSCLLDFFPHSKYMCCIFYPIFVELSPSLNIIVSSLSLYCAAVFLPHHNYLYASSYY